MNGWNVLKAAAELPQTLESKEGYVWISQKRGRRSHGEGGTIDGGGHERTTWRNGLLLKPLVYSSLRCLLSSQRNGDSVNNDRAGDRTNVRADPTCTGVVWQAVTQIRKK